MKYFVGQFDESSCALSSVRTLACLVSKKRGWKRLSFSSHPPYSLKDLEDEMKNYGFDLQFYQSEKDCFNYPFGKEEPFLVVLNLDENKTHMVVVLKIEEGVVSFYDPAEGKRQMKVAPFLSIWSGYWGVMEQFEIQTPPKRKAIIKPWRQILSNFLLVLAESLLALGLAFLDKIPLWVSAVFIALSITLEEGRRYFILSSMKAFDDQWIGRVYDEDNHLFKQKYERYCSFKKNLFADWSALISQIGACLLIIVIVGINTPSFFLSLGGVLSFLAGEKFISHKFFQSKRNRLRKEEEKLYESKEESEKIQLLYSLSNGTHDYGTAAFIERGLLLLFVIVFSFLPSILTGEGALNFYLFHLFALLMCQKGGADIIDYILFKREREADHNYFLEYFAKGNP